MQDLSLSLIIWTTNLFTIACCNPTEKKILTPRPCIAPWIFIDLIMESCKWRSNLRSTMCCSAIKETWLTIKFANSPPCVCVFFFYIRGIVHYEFVPTWQTVNQVYYFEVLKRLREKVRRKRPEIFANNSWILHHDNAPAHTALFVREFLATKQITVLEHPAFSPDLAPNDFFCSRR